MLKKIVLGLSFVGITFSATLTELLDSVQRLIGEYEREGKALTHPYVYNKLVNYYNFGKLYSSYMLDKQAIEMLSMASCSALPVDCKADKYFLTNITYGSYSLALKRMPVILADVESSYNAYAEWWIAKRTSKEDLYREYKNLENILKEKFLNAWRAYLTAAPKPIYFLVSHKLDWNDLFLVAMLKVAYYNGWIKKISYKGKWGNFRELVANGVLPTSAEYLGKNPEGYTIDYLIVY